MNCALRRVLSYWIFNGLAVFFVFFKKREPDLTTEKDQQEERCCIDCLGFCCKKFDPVQWKACQTVTVLLMLCNTEPDWSGSEAADSLAERT